jgi:hypothetical protein
LREDDTRPRGTSADSSAHGPAATIDRGLAAVVEFSPDALIAHEHATQAPHDKGPSSGSPPDSDRADRDAESRPDAAAAAAGAETKKANGDPLSEEEKKQVEELKKRDAQVRQHEQAHKAAAGGYAKGGPNFEYQTGPDGNQYAVGGSVQIDTSEVPGDPQATIQKMAVIRGAALAPGDPSSQDRAVAAEAARKAQQARQEHQAQSSNEAQAGNEAQAPRGAVTGGSHGRGSDDTANGPGEDAGRGADEAVNDARGPAATGSTHEGVPPSNAEPNGESNGRSATGVRADVIDTAPHGFPKPSGSSSPPVDGVARPQGIATGSAVLEVKVNPYFPSTHGSGYTTGRLVDALA